MILLGMEGGFYLIIIVFFDRDDSFGVDKFCGFIKIL